MRHLLVAGLAWLVAQSLKHAFRLFGRNRRVFQQNPIAPLLVSGGMPSGHSAVVTALAISVGAAEGWSGATFAVAAVVAVIVMYDAMMVRLSSGKQGEALNELIQRSYPEMKQVKIAHGHTSVEVLAGALIGAVIAVVVIFATK